MFCFVLQFLFCCMLYCLYNIIIMCPDSLCLNLRYPGVAYFIPDDLGWLSAIYYLDKFLGRTFFYMRVVHTSHQEVCSVYLAEYYSNKKIQGAFFLTKKGLCLFYLQLNLQEPGYLLLFVLCIPLDSCIDPWPCTDPAALWLSWESQGLAVWEGGSPEHLFHCLHGYTKASVHLYRFYYCHTLERASLEVIRRVTVSNYWELPEKLKKQ